MGDLIGNDVGNGKNFECGSSSSSEVSNHLFREPRGHHFQFQ